MRYTIKTVYLPHAKCKYRFDLYRDGVRKMSAWGKYGKEQRYLVNWVKKLNEGKVARHVNKAA